MKNIGSEGRGMREAVTVGRKGRREFLRKMRITNIVEASRDMSESE